MSEKKQSADVAEKLKEKAKKIQDVGKAAQQKSMDIHAKNMEVLKNVHKVSSEAIKSVTDMHKNHLKKSAAAVTSSFKDMAEKLKTFQQDPKCGVFAIKEQMSDLMAHHKAVAENWEKSTKEVMDMMSKRMQESVKETQDMMSVK